MKNSVLATLLTILVNTMQFVNHELFNMKTSFWCLDMITIEEQARCRHDRMKKHRNVVHKDDTQCGPVGNATGMQSSPVSCHYITETYTSLSFIHGVRLHWMPVHWNWTTLNTVTTCHVSALSTCHP